MVGFFFNFKIVLNIGIAKKCQLQAILNMTTKFDMSLDLLRKMFPVVHTRLSPSFFSLSIFKKQTKKAINFSRMTAASKPTVLWVPGFSESM